MGEVYRAEQRVPIRRQVAIKLIKLGMDTKQVIARFEAERQALALMDHPHIAKVLDASTDDSGRPYFVMEYVKGIPINEYADKNQLTIQERLGLFGQVCHAIQHAHHKGVIHRDIKPSNVLTYTQDGKPHAKIIDFGIAKAIAQQLTDQTFYTLHSQFLGTPQYMSPEQAEGNLDIDTRTDVYSLGVMLYELLTGTTPFSIAELKAGAVDQIRKIICETEPPKPSTRLTIETATLTAIAAARRVEPTRLGALVRGELDWIVMMALDKDRRRRYDTPNDLADDIEAYLQGERVKAAPPSRVYLMQKFVRKNKGAVAIASILGTSLGVGLAGTSWQWFRADRNAKTAELSSSEAKAARQRAEDALQQAEKERALAIEQRDNAEFEAYVANLNFANGAVERGEYREAQEYLKRCSEKHRGWEWDFLNEMTDGNQAFMIQDDEDRAIDSSKRALVKVRKNGQGAIYRAASINQPTSFVIPFEFDISTDWNEMFPKQLKVETSADGNVVYLPAKLREASGHAIVRIDLTGKCQALKSSEELELITVSNSGNRVVTRLPDESYKIFNFGEAIDEELTIPAINGVHLIGFANANDSRLIVIEENVALVYDFVGPNTEPRVTILDQSQHTQLVSALAGNMVVLSNSSLDDAVARYLGKGDMECTLLSDNRHYCILRDDLNNCELWSILTRKRIASLPHAHQNWDFSKDSQRLVIFNSKEIEGDYQLRGEPNENIDFLSTQRVDANIGLLSDRYLVDFQEKRTPNGPYDYYVWSGKIQDRQGRVISPQCAIAEEISILLFDRVFLDKGEDHDQRLVCNVSDLVLFPSTSTKLNAELIDLCNGDVPGFNKTKTETKGEFARRFTIHADFLRVEDSIRMRRLVDIHFAFPKDARAMLLSNDNKRIYLSAYDGSWVCYDTRTRKDRREWLERVFDQKQRAESIVDTLWDGDMLFNDLRDELHDVRPLELCEAALIYFDARRSAIVKEADAEFQRLKYQYVGCKDDWFVDESERRPRNRLFRADGPLAVQIADWNGEPTSDDFHRFSIAVLSNELPDHLIRRLHIITKDYMAHIRKAYSNKISERKYLICIIALLRAGYRDEAKEILAATPETALSVNTEPRDPPTREAIPVAKELELRCIRRCIETWFAISEMDVEKAEGFMAIASTAKQSLKSKDSDVQKFYEETLTLLNKLRANSK